MTDINIKQLMFKHKMKQIEDDIVPFGHIDQGDTYIEPPSEERPWALDHADQNF